MSGLEKILRTGFYDFGGVIVFWALWKLVSLKAAIAGTLVFVALDIWRRRRFGIGFPRLYILTTSAGDRVRRGGSRGQDAVHAEI